MIILSQKIKCYDVKDMHTRLVLFLVGTPYYHKGTLPISNKERRRKKEIELEERI